MLSLDGADEKDAIIYDEDAVATPIADEEIPRPSSSAPSSSEKKKPRAVFCHHMSLFRSGIRLFSKSIDIASENASNTRISKSKSTGSLQFTSSGHSKVPIPMLPTAVSFSDGKCGDASCDRFTPVLPETETDLAEYCSERSTIPLRSIPFCQSANGNNHNSTSRLGREIPRADYSASPKNVCCSCCEQFWNMKDLTLPSSAPSCN